MTILGIAITKSSTLNALLDEMAALREQIQAERSERAVAQVLAKERQAHLDEMADRLRHAETARDEAIKARITSLDMVNTSLLNQSLPGHVEVKPIEKTARQIVSISRQRDRDFYNHLLQKTRPAVTEQVA